MRSTQPRQLRRLLSGDLDTIVLRALQKDPARRYQTVEQLSEDLRRYAANLPILAHPESLSYQAYKFVRRHRIGVAVALVVVVSLLTGLVAALWQARIAGQERQKAERRFADVRQLATGFLFEFHDAIAELPGSTPARELVVKRSLEHLDRLAGEVDDDPALQLELATAYRKVGDVQGNPTNANLGQTRGALESYGKALAIARSLVAERPEDREAREALALIHERLADVQASTGALGAADSSMQAAVALYRALAAEAPDTAASRVQYAVGLIKLGDLSGNPNFPNRGDPQAAFERYLAAKPLLERASAADTSRARAFRLLGLVYERMGTIHEVLEEPPSALEAYRRSLEIREAYAAAHPGNTDAIRDLGIAYEKMANAAVALRDLAAAQSYYDRAREIFERLWKVDPQNVQAQQSLAISHLHLGDLSGYPDQPNLGDPATARRHYRAAIGLLEELRARDSTNTHTGYLLDVSRDRLARAGS